MDKTKAKPLDLALAVAIASASFDLLAHSFRRCRRALDDLSVYAEGYQEGYNDGLERQPSRMSRGARTT